MSVRIPAAGVPQTRLPESQPVAPRAPIAPSLGYARNDTFQADGGEIGRRGRTQRATPPPATQPAAPAANTRAEPLQPETNTALQARLSAMPAPERERATQFLNQHVLNTPNADRATRTFLDLSAMQAARPARLSMDTVETLTRGVAEPRGTGAAGQEGILGPAQARAAASAMVGMTGEDFNALQGALRNAGTRDGQPVPNADVQTERSLILKAVGARSQEMTAPGALDRVRNFFGDTTSDMDEVTRFARDIAGTPRATLINQSTAIDVNAGAGALQQRFDDSCAPTAAQVAHADADPVYARRMHREPIHSLDANTNIGREQRRVLENNGGIARPRQGGTGDSLGVSPDAMRDMFNRGVSPSSNRTYATQTIPDSPQARQGALDRADRLLRDGVDVPFAVQWSGGGGHAMVMSDVRGQGANREYLVTDPMDGRTGWVRGSDIAAGNTRIGPGTGRLAWTFE
ncbi:hypothetical protein JYK02_03630 [Corallococcus macrosporus]|uniref:Peptidase C39-like domain-containing protein n=1 Tax=Corallococcus macrosporus TaxID=35 RepID=A0ABS3D4K9_9BACT|nr:hypothetical protein [Corallococcus macrosporus]MBN8226595.1 hypothetical protein [Corallococcus macrosporus]